MIQKINPDDNSSCSNNPEEKAEDPKKDNAFLTFEEIRSRRQTAQSKFMQKKYFTAVFGENKK